MAVSLPESPLRKAVQLFQAGRRSEAASQCSILLRKQPKSYETLYLLGVIRSEDGNLDEATALFTRALAVKPRSYDVLANLGIVQLKSGQHAAAADSLRRAIAIDSSQALAHDVLGLALAGTLTYHEAIKSFQKALTIKADYAEAYMHLALVQMELGAFDAAIRDLRTALSIKPGLGEARHQLAISLMRLQRHGEAAENLRRVVAANPSLASAHCNLGLCLRELGDYEQAIASFRTALKHSPGHIQALNALGNTLKRLGRHDAALIAYDTVLELDPLDANALSMAAFLRRTTCEWNGIDRVERDLIQHVRANSAPVMPFPFLAVTDDPSDQRACARQFWNVKMYPAIAAPPAVPREANGRLRLGYLSADFHGHATAYLMAQLFEEHDRSRFEVFAFSHGPDDGSPMRRRLMAAFDGFFDVRQQSDADVARLIAEHRIDILVDLKGHTENGRLEILGRSGKAARLEARSDVLVRLLPATCLQVDRNSFLEALIAEDTYR